ncbi:hypothetical protein TNCV_2740291 [Trichonephila clavipes]|nr:hypothetical protein TNCV_2740291 [Trichonephila clavipes]
MVFLLIQSKPETGKPFFTRTLNNLPLETTPNYFHPEGKPSSSYKSPGLLNLFRLTVQQPGHLTWLSKFSSSSFIISALGKRGAAPSIHGWGAPNPNSPLGFAAGN